MVNGEIQYYWSEEAETRNLFKIKSKNQNSHLLNKTRHSSCFYMVGFAIYP